MKKSLIYLLVLTVLAVLAVWMLAPRDPSTGYDGSSSLFLSEMADKINDVARVEIIKAGQQPVATLVKATDNWQVEQMGGYPADWPKLQKLLAALATAQVVEIKTDKPEYYSRLGVEDVNSEDAAGVLVKLTAGERTVGIIIGNKAQGRSGQYVRLQGQAVSALVNKSLAVATEANEWANKRIVDISSPEVAEVEIVHPDGERVLVTKTAADQTDFELVGKPPEREIRSSWAVNSLGSVLSLLDLETANAGSDLDWSSAVRMRVLLFSGVEIMADMMESNGENLIRLQASHPGAKVTASQGEDPLSSQAADDIAKSVDEINRRVTGWTYGIARHKYDAMVKRTEDLLKPPESA